MNVPNQIHGKGTEGNYDTIVIEVRICRDRETGAVWSLNDYQEEADLSMASQWPGGGTQAIASSLITEAVRRTTHSYVLSYLSNTDPDFLRTYLEASLEKKREMETLLASSVEELLGRSVKRIAPSVAEEMLRMMSSLIPPDKAQV